MDPSYLSKEDSSQDEISNNNTFPHENYEICNEYEEDSYLPEIWDDHPKHNEIKFEPIYFKKAETMIDWSLLVKDNDNLIADIMDMPHPDDAEVIDMSCVNEHLQVGSEIDVEPTIIQRETQCTNYYLEHSNKEPPFTKEDVVNQIIHMPEVKSNTTAKESDKFHNTHTKTSELQKEQDIIEGTASDRTTGAYSPQNKKDDSNDLTTRNIEDCVDHLLLSKMEIIYEEEEPHENGISDLDILVDKILQTEAEGEELDEKNKGYNLLENMGWQRGEGVGTGMKYPLGHENGRLNGDKRTLGAPPLEQIRKRKPRTWPSTESIKHHADLHTVCKVPEPSDSDSWLYGMEVANSENTPIGKEISSQHVPITIGTQKFLALIDTGASVSVLPARILDSHPKEKYQQIRTNIKGIGNTNLRSAGQIISDCLIGQVRFYNQKFVILEESDLPVEAVIGLDIILKNELIIDPHKNIMTNNSGVEIKLINKYKSTYKKGKLFVAEETNIPPLSRRFILGKVLDPFWENKNVLFYKDIEENLPDGVLLGRCINTIVNNEMIIPVINATNDPIIISKECQIGEIKILQTIDAEGDSEEFFWMDQRETEAGKCRN